MTLADGGHREDHPLQQFDALVRGENAGIGHGMVLIDRKPALVGQDAHAGFSIATLDRTPTGVKPTTPSPVQRRAGGSGGEHDRVGQALRDDLNCQAGAGPHVFEIG